MGDIFLKLLNMSIQMGELSVVGSSSNSADLSVFH